MSIICDISAWAAAMLVMPDRELSHHMFPKKLLLISTIVAVHVNVHLIGTSWSSEYLHWH